jgi:hypothetical protein
MDDLDKLPSFCGVGTIDALLGQLYIRHELILLTTNADFTLAARHCPLRVWSPAL